MPEPMRRVLIPVQLSDAPLPKGPVRRAGGTAMGTSWSVQVAGPGLDLQRAVEAELDDVIGEMSHWRDDSDLCRFNTAPAGTAVELPADLFHVVAHGAAVGRAFEGAFNPYAGELVNRWGFGPRNRYEEPGFAPPSAALTDAARERATHALTGAVVLDGERRTALQPGGVLLDLSAIAKGFSVDKVARMLESHGVRDYLVEVGGELRGAGVKPDGQPWWVELESLPGAEVPETVVALHGLSIATSGDYRRFFENEGARSAHTIDPRTGQPIRHGVASLTVFHPECMLADALSTALTVLGPDEGMCFAEREGIAMRMLVREGDGFRELASSRFLEMLQ